jgi:tetratricopeptide (TPR) repeat protein
MSRKRKIITATVLSVLLAVSCFVLRTVLRADTPDNIDTARKLYFGLDLKGTERVLQRILAAPDEQPKVRAKALRMQARIAWKFHRKSEKTYELLRQAEDLKIEDREYGILALLSRVERESGEFQKALETARRAIELAASERQWVEARSLWAQVIWEESLARIEDDQPFDEHLVEQGVATLEEVLRKAPGYPRPSRILLGLALLARDGKAAFTAWKSYFNIVEDDPPKGILPGPHDLLREVLPRWRGRSPSRQEGLMLIRGLGDSRFYGYGKLVKQLFFKNDPFSDEPDVRDMLLYADTIDSFRKTADEYYRMLSLGKKDEVAFGRSLLKEAERLWLALSFQGERPDFSLESFRTETKKRFGAHINIILRGTGNNTGKVLIMGHLTDQQRQTIEQYGFESEFGYLLSSQYAIRGRKQDLCP